MEDLNKNFGNIDARFEMLETRMERHDNLLYGVNYLNVPGVVDKIDHIERYIKRVFWILVFAIILSMLLNIFFIAAILWAGVV